jgi:ornithine carbamoyltransferase
MELQGRDFISTDDYSRDELLTILDLAKKLKIKQRAGELITPLRGKTLAMIFQKPSNRTRLSFEIGMHQLGGHALYISGPEIGMGQREPIADVARVMARYVDAVMIRANFHSDVVSFAEYASVPVINGLSDLEHPCQAMADILTILEHRGSIEGCRVCYIGDGNNVCHSLISVCGKLGLEMVVACPPGYEPAGDERRGACKIVHDPHQAIEGADVVYTDTWTSMGQEDQSRIRRRDFAGFTIDLNMFRKAKANAIFMHCLPAHRGEEVEDEIIESSQSVIFDQAENRLHAQKAIILALLNVGVYTT